LFGFLVPAGSCLAAATSGTKVRKSVWGIAEGAFLGPGRLKWHENGKLKEGEEKKKRWQKNPVGGICTPCGAVSQKGNLNCHQNHIFLFPRHEYRSK
jgi:hypothetical protein